LREYSLRMSIEQNFRDDKSGGFDLAHTRLQHAQRIDHLLLAMAIATLWCHELGEFVLQQGDASRSQVDPAHQRTLSCQSSPYNTPPIFTNSAPLIFTQSAPLCERG